MKAASLLLILAAGGAAAAQVAKGPMAPMEFMLGTWTGDGWSQAPGGQKRTFKHVETLTLKLNGSMIQDEMYDLDENGKPTRHGLVMMGYDATAKTFKVWAFQPGGRCIEGVASATGSVFEWSTKIAATSYRWKVTITGDQWVESGELSTDGQQWTQFMQLNLRRKKEAATGTAN